jgi:hypothetical protein
VEHAGGQHRVRSCIYGRREVRQRTRAAAGHDRDGDDGADGPDQLQVEAARGAVRVHGVQQDLAGAEPHSLPRPVHRVDPGANPAAVRGHLKAARRGRRVDGTPRVYRQDDAL